jgi:hypothetical protein
MIDRRQSGRRASVEKVEKGSWLAAILPAVVFLAVNMYIASRRLFWHGETGTVLVARLPSDFLPVAHYAIVWASAGLFGPGEFAAGLQR